METHNYFDAHNSERWTPAQKSAVRKVTLLSRQKYQTALDELIAHDCTDYDRLTYNELQEVQAVLEWFLNSDYYKINWVNNAIRRELNHVKNEISQVEREYQANRRNDYTSGVKESYARNKNNKGRVQEKPNNKNSSSTSVEAPKTPAPKKTADVDTEFPTFEEPSFPDTSKDIFTEMLSKGSKMPKV